MPLRGVVGAGRKREANGPAGIEDVDSTSSRWGFPVPGETFEG